MHEIVLYDIDADNRGHLQVSVPRLCDAVYTWRGGGAVGKRQRAEL